MGIKSIFKTEKKINANDLLHYQLKISHATLKFTQPHAYLFVLMNHWF